MKRYRNYFIAAAAALLLSFLCAAASFFSLPPLQTYLLPGDAAPVLEQGAELSCADCELDGQGNLSVTGSDPQLILSGVTGSVGTLCVKVSDLAAGTRCQLYYAPAGGELSEENSIILIASSGQTELLYCLEPGNYDLLRLDIDGNCVIREILISAEQPSFETVSSLSAGFAAVNVLQWLFALLILLAEALLIAWQWGRVCAWLSRKRRWCRAHRRGILTGALILTAVLAASVLVWALLCMAGVLTLSACSCFYFLMAGAAIGGIAVLHRQASEHPERLFLVLILCVGLVLAVVLPKSTIVSWDDETHYSIALRLSYFGRTYLTQADTMLITQTMPRVESASQAAELSASLNELYKAGATGIVADSIRAVLRPAYLPMAAGIWLARVLGLPFAAIFTAGRIGNLLFYAVVLYFAMKRLPGGAMLTGVFALLPTAIFLASGYSYDSWCIAFLALGCAVFLDEYQHPERPVRWGTVALMLVSLALGCLPKAIYFPVFLMCLFLPKEKFAYPAQRRRYCLLVVGVTFCVACSFLLPFLFAGGSGMSDVRGGSDVNSGGQLAGILASPFGYIVLLMRFLFTAYFVPSFVVKGGFSLMGYLGIVPIGALFALLLVLVFLAERPRPALALRRSAPALKAAALVSFFCAVCLAATAMYIAYTPVGSPTISGCQPRYMLPILLPMLAQVRPNRLWVPLPRRWYCLGVAAAQWALLFAGLWPMLACYL